MVLSQETISGLPDLVLWAAGREVDGAGRTAGALSGVTDTTLPTRLYLKSLPSSSCSIFEGSGK